LRSFMSRSGVLVTALNTFNLRSCTSVVYFFKKVLAWFCGSIHSVNLSVKFMITVFSTVNGSVGNSALNHSCTFMGSPNVASSETPSERLMCLSSIQPRHLAISFCL
jgi:hypothetical protein